MTRGYHKPGHSMNLRVILFQAESANRMLLNTAGTALSAKSKTRRTYQSSFDTLGLPKMSVCPLLFDRYLTPFQTIQKSKVIKQLIIKS